ncbi:SDR family NAD(P)-dependent oxidoreductase [Ruegeria sp. R14_0]|uniref:SDR family NAD(P)-dependent oxidoreductase n=1 Tax=Ruegeria sp. R14_0 TaxID=2821100 RepID=UPI001ADA75B9|nr:SDR family NAD(P)-dependent oxidoreductase [Ruegeria sp. R14_0]MBO9446314.1 SDR family NAD(P)-dependent oxidoreductase [Ruegeria sp. R14_0]
MKPTAVITGGAGGLGRALSAALRETGWHTVLIDLPGPELDALANLDDVSTYACDLTDPDQCADTCDRILHASDSIDLVIYNAGVSQISAFSDSDMGAHRNLFEINYFAAVTCAQHFLEAVRSAKGTHLAISSVAGFAPLIHRTAYAASKHAMEGFFKSLRAEEAAHGVQVSIAAPSFVATNIGRPEAAGDGFVRPGSATDGIDYMEPEAAAQVILRGYQQRKEYIPVGRVARIANLLNRVAPRFYVRQMMRTVGKQRPS